VTTRWLTVALVTAVAANVSAGEFRFGDRSMRGQVSDMIRVVGPENQVVAYTEAQTKAFEDVDEVLVQAMRERVLLHLPWRLYGKNNVREHKPLKVVFTTKGTRDVVAEFPAETESVPLSNAFGKESVGLACSTYSLGLPIFGTAGLVFTAKRKGVIPAVRPLLDALRARGFRLRQAVYEEILEAAGETPRQPR
jgi:hypothetical protein